MTLHQAELESFPPPGWNVSQLERLTINNQYTTLKNVHSMPALTHLFVESNQSQPPKGVGDLTALENVTLYLAESAPAPYMHHQLGLPLTVSLESGRFLPW